MDHYALIARATTQGAQVALTCNETLKEICFIDKHRISKELAFIIRELCAKMQNSSSSLSYLGVSRGPAPFSSLRSVISTINGFAFGLNLPVVQLDDLFLAQFAASIRPERNTLILFNAYHQQYYYSFCKGTSEMERGAATFVELREKIETFFLSEPFVIASLGTLPILDELQKQFDKQVFEVINVLEAKMLEMLANQSFILFKQDSIARWARPLYLKDTVYQQSILPSKNCN